MQQFTYVVIHVVHFYSFLHGSFVSSHRTENTSSIHLYNYILYVKKQI